MLTLILFVIFAAWLIYDFIATKNYIDDYGPDTLGVAFKMFLAAPIDLFNWIKSKF